MWLAWDTDGNVVATLDCVTRKDEQGRVIGLVDFASAELAGASLKAVIATVDGAVGSGTWPVWLGVRAHEFRVEIRAGTKGETPLITALVHRTSGYRMERAVIEAEIAAAVSATPSGEPADLRAIVGGPTAPVVLDTDGVAVEPKPDS